MSTAQNLDDEAKARRQAEIKMYADKAMRRAINKASTYAAKGLRTCEVNLQYPTNHPDDEYSEEVALLIKEVLEGQGFKINLRQRTKHTGCYVKVSW